ncbi:MAG: S8 family peptidase [Lachnospiraceae bacterium]|nr:S8 family peptidase [Lachnospiraceae bacterium]
MTPLTEQIISNDYADYIVPLASSISDFLIDYASYGPQVQNENYGLLHVERGGKTPFEIYTDYSLLPKLFTTLNTISLEVAGITQAQTQTSLGLTGKGVLVGFIDTGIDYLHPAFRALNGNSRIVSIWDQTIDSDTPPETYDYGTQYTQAQLNEAIFAEDPYALVPTRDIIGHGTRIAGAACGTPNLQAEFMGAAYDAQLCVVKLKEAKPYLEEYFFANGSQPAYQENDIMMGIRYLVEQSTRLSLPLILCFALGTNQGDHSGTTPLNNMLSRYPRFPGMIPVIAGGNEGGRAHHYQRSTSTTTEVEILVQEDTAGFTLELWGNATGLYSVGLQTPLGQQIDRIPARPGQSNHIQFVLEKTTLVITYEILQTASGNQLIFFRFMDPSPGIWKIRVYPSSNQENTFFMWLPITGLMNRDVTFLEPSPYTTLTTPANDSAVLATTTFNAYDGSLYIHSSRGYTRTNVIKPDLASPGVNVSAPKPGGTYTAATGSSMAAALLSGSVALVQEWALQQSNRPFTIGEIRGFLVRGATREETLEYPNRDWGYGKLNLYNSFLSLM